ncbi:MAG: cytochrome B6, partial [Steroidobacteraceae bacterium]
MSSTRVRMVLFVSLTSVAALSARAVDVPNVYADVVDRVSFDEVRQRMQSDTANVVAAHRKLLESRYDLSDRPSSTVKMSRGKPVQVGVRVKLPQGVTWAGLGALAPADIRKRDVYPAGFLPLPHPNHPEGGMLFPKSHIDLVKAQEGRDLSR